MARFHLHLSMRSMRATRTHACDSTIGRRTLSLHAEQLLYLPGVRQIRSFMVLKEILSTTKFPL